MGDTYSNFLAHLIFSTKNREPLIRPDFENRIFSYIGGIIKGERGYLLAAGAMPDHVHLLVNYRPFCSISDLVRQIKSGSSKWINSEGFVKMRFSWQTGYSGFSVSESELGRVTKYILSQKVHHQKRTFKEELIAILKLHGVSYDEEYLWE